MIFYRHKAGKEHSKQYFNNRCPLHKYNFIEAKVTYYFSEPQYFPTKISGLRPCVSEITQGLIRRILPSRNRIKCIEKNFDPDYEAYLWIGDDGHGRNGAPYHIKDIVSDMEEAEEQIYELLQALEVEFI